MKEELIINNVKFDTEHPISKTFNNWSELNDWWVSNPKAYRISPDIKASNLEEYNKINHNIEFPTKMTFVFPI